MSQVVAVTGANGFVGRALSRLLSSQGHRVVGLVRSGHDAADGIHEKVLVGDDFAGLEAAWPEELRCDGVVHLAARVHVVGDASEQSLSVYRSTNVSGSLRVAKAARRAGAQRFVFVSSIKAIAETGRGHALKESDLPEPGDAYGISKLEAERALLEYGRESGLEVVIVRPPLVYGPGVKANFFSLMRAIANRVPLPLGAVGARRSLLFVDNLADALMHCLLHPLAPGQTFHVADGVDLSVTELARALADELQVPARLWRVPVPWLRLAGSLAGRSDQIDRLVGELRLDSSHIREVLGWSAPYTVEEGLRETATWYRSTH
jgi:UDP-glucose 4-epimerase